MILGSYSMIYVHYIFIIQFKYLSQGKLISKVDYLFWFWIFILHSSLEMSRMSKSLLKGWLTCPLNKECKNVAMSPFGEFNMFKFIHKSINIKSNLKVIWKANLSFHYIKCVLGSANVWI